MKASLDTNIIIHLYRAKQQHILFDLFQDGLYIYEFLVNVELKNHGQDILPDFMADVKDGKINIITNDELKDKGIYTLFCSIVKNEKILYNPGDLGEVYAISLARILGAMSLVTNDIKDFGPHRTLIQEPDSDVVPFSVCEVLFMLVLINIIDTTEMIDIYNSILKSNPSYKISIKASFFIFDRRFHQSFYTTRETKWMDTYCLENNVDYLEKSKLIKQAIKNTVV